MQRTLYGMTMMAELLFSAISIFFLGDHLWAVIAIVSLNLLLSAVFLSSGSAGHAVSAEAEKQEEIMKKASDEALACSLSQLETEFALSFSCMPLYAVEAFSRTLRKDLELWIDNGILPHIGDRESPFVDGALLLELFKDDEGRFHLTDDFRKPLTAADIKSAVARMESRKERSHA